MRYEITAANSKMDQLSEATVAALIRNWILWVAIFGLLYIFSLYVYFFPTPLTQPFVSGPQQEKTDFLPPKN